MGRNEIILFWGLSFPFCLNSLWHLIKMIKRKEKRNYLFMFMCSMELVCAVIPLLSNRLIGLTCLSTGLYFLAIIYYLALTFSKVSVFFIARYK